MTMSGRNIGLFALMALLLMSVGFIQSWDVSLTLLNLCIISAIMALGVNIQWGYAGLFNVGTMGFAALGGLAAMLVSVPPVTAAWKAGGAGVVGGIVAAVVTVIAGMYAWRKTADMGRSRYWVTGLVVLVGYVVLRSLIDPAVSAIEKVDATKAGYLGGFGLPIIFSWLVGGVFAAGAAWVVGRISLGLRSDYLAIATLGISEIIIYMLKFEDWLTRGVKNVAGLPRPVPYEVDLNESAGFQSWATGMGLEVETASSILVKLCYAGLFSIVLLVVLYLSEVALRSPWGRMMRAIRDNETAAAAMGKNVTSRHLQVFILGSAVIGVAGAMLTTLDGQFTPDHLSAASLHLPDLGDGDCRRFGQQLGCGAWRLRHLVLLDRGRADRPLADEHADLRHGGRALAAPASDRERRPYAAVDDGAGLAACAAVRAARADTRGQALTPQTGCQ